jgi:hypothetical protein
MAACFLNDGGLRKLNSLTIMRKPIKSINFVAC